MTQNKPVKVGKGVEKRKETGTLPTKVNRRKVYMQFLSKFSLFGQLVGVITHYTILEFNSSWGKFAVIMCHWLVYIQIYLFFL